MGYKARCLDNFSIGKEENMESFLGNENFELIKGDIKHSNADIDKAKKLIGYKPEYSFAGGI